jgi:hypothetical protein
MKSLAYKGWSVNYVYEMFRIWFSIIFVCNIYVGCEQICNYEKVIRFFKTQWLPTEYAIKG